jgi:hypothetical protein
MRGIVCESLVCVRVVGIRLRSRTLRDVIDVLLTMSVFQDIVGDGRMRRRVIHGRGTPGAFSIVCGVRMPRGIARA